MHSLDNLYSPTVYTHMRKWIPHCLVGILVIFSEYRTKELAFYYILLQQNSLERGTRNVSWCTDECAMGIALAIRNLQFDQMVSKPESPGLSIFKSRFAKYHTYFNISNHYFTQPLLRVNVKQRKLIWVIKSFSLYKGKYSCTWIGKAKNRQLWVY